jgi:hypothetical protein
MNKLESSIELRELFATEKLPLPKLPPELLQRLNPSAPQLWDSEARLPHPEDLPQWTRLAGRSERDLLQIGFAGRGINSWSLHLNLVQKGLAIFLQCRWGNAYDDAAASRQRIEGVMSFVDMLLERSQEARAAGVLAPKERLTVCFADHFPSRWQWSSEGSDWHHDGDFTLLAAVGALDDRLKAAGAGQA